MRTSYKYGPLVAMLEKIKCVRAVYISGCVYIWSRNCLKRATPRRIHGIPAPEIYTTKYFSASFQSSKRCRCSCKIIYKPNRIALLMCGTFIPDTCISLFCSHQGNVPSCLYHHLHGGWYDLFVWSTNIFPPHHLLWCNHHMSHSCG